MQDDQEKPVPEPAAAEPDQSSTETEKPAADQSEALVKSDAKPPEKVGASMTTKVGVGFSLALGAVALGSFVLFRMMNRIKLVGAENIPSQHENVLYCLNHNSMLDNFAFETTIYLPKIFFKPEYLPVNLADRKNFFGDPDSRKFKDRVLGLLGKHFFTHLRAYPVDRKSKDMSQVDHWIELLKHNIVVVFPEGTRSRSGEIGEGKAGVGKLIYQARPTVIPVRMLGTENVLAVGRIIPRAFQTIHIIIGKPLDLTEWLNHPLPETEFEQNFYYKAISEEVVQAIKDLTPESKK